MNKLLLLATTFLSLTIKTYSNDLASVKKSKVAVILSDSSIKDQLLADPKKGFKDLFVSVSSNSMNMTKLNPRAISFVQDYMSVHGSRLNRMKSWGRPYFDLISSVLAQHGLPSELKYLAVIESDLKSSALSWAGAVGPWQFMPYTAKDLGLVVSRYRDDRTDYMKSTHAAARYLTSLWGVFNDWLLVIAAYNCGPGVVNRAISKSHSRNFWDLQYYLPEESRNHVKKFIATHYIMEGDGGETTLTKKEREGFQTTPKLTAADSSTVVTSVSGRYSSLAIAKIIQINLAEFNRLNPNFDKMLSSNGAYDLRLPADKMASFEANKPQILEESLRVMLAL
jgi:membrane-bound lytic murein transglycosylase D